MKTQKPPRRIRSDGWTLPRQRLFIQMLARTGSVEKAADHAQMSSSAAHRLRNHPDFRNFRHAWQAALNTCPMTLREIAFDRAINGTREKITENGVVVGYRAVFNDRLLMFMLRRYDGGLAQSPHQRMIDSFASLVEADVPEWEGVYSPRDSDDETLDDTADIAADNATGE